MPGPLTYDPDTADALLDLVADGISLRAACEKLEIPRRTVRSWIERKPEFAATYDAARKLGIDAHVDRMLDIAASVTGSDSNAAVQAARVEIDAIKWLSAKLLPTRYGDKVALTGADGRDLIPANREARLPQLVAALAVLLPGTANGELFDLAGALLDRLTDGAALPALAHDDAAAD